MKDPVGDRLKALERASQSYVDAGYLYMRLDGRNFSNLTRMLQKPLDVGLQKTMVWVTEQLVKELGAAIGYTQSDEISLVWLPREPGQEWIFGGRTDKLLSTSAALATNAFANGAETGEIEMMVRGGASFDSRIVDALRRDQAVDFLKWRSLDCRRNAISMFAQSVYSHKQLQGVSTSSVLQMMEADGHTDAFIALGDAFRFGTTITYLREERMLTQEELELIPEKYRPTGPILRRTMHYHTDVKSAEKFDSLLPRA